MVKNLKFIWICLIAISLIIFTGCSWDAHENKGIKEKTDEEISYIENKILTFFSKYAKNEYGNSLEELDWQEIENSVIDLNNVLDTIILDFTEIEISNEDIIEFRNGINDLSIACTNRDINLVLEKSSFLYSLLPTYMEKYSENKNEINILKLKSLVVSSFTYSSLYDWENAKTTIGLAENKYKEMMDDVDYMKEYAHNLNKVYILLEEFKSSIDNEEADLLRLFFLR